jgi:hypothetical protein
VQRAMSRRRRAPDFACEHMKEARVPPLRAVALMPPPPACARPAPSARRPTAR